MAEKWNEIVENGKTGNSAVIDVNMWLGKATLDAYVPATKLDVCGSGTHIPKGSALGLSSTTSVP